jgi:Adenylate and Guanylate cyclase catalytic domain
MESNGQVNRIHVSEATADLLKGKINVTPREDKIVAKGKGEMQTYFVDVKGSASSISSGSARHSNVFDQGHATELLEETIVKFERIIQKTSSQLSMATDRSERMLLISPAESAHSQNSVQHRQSALMFKACSTHFQPNLLENFDDDDDVESSSQSL